MNSLRWIRGLLWGLVILVGLIWVPWSAGVGSQGSTLSAVRPLPTIESDTVIKAEVQAAYSKLPLFFEVNQGQVDPQVKFLSRSSGSTLFLTDTQAVLILKQRSAISEQQSASKIQHPGPQTPDPGLVLRLQLVGANPMPRVTGLEELPGKRHYLSGNDPKQRHTDIPTYASVKYWNVYPGIDLVFYGHQRQLEYDFIVAPGADPRVIKLAFAGVDKLEIDAQENLAMQTAGSEVRLHKPRIYQETDGSKKAVPGRYIVLPLPEEKGRGEGTPQVGFQVAAYDASKPLVIDPVLSYATYLGGSGEDMAFGIAVDSSGAAYVTGISRSANFPTANASQGAPVVGAFVAKLNAAGNALVYSTSLSGGSSGHAIAVDALGNAYVTGDAFVAKLNVAGSALVYFRPLGTGQGIAVDALGNAYVTGWTRSPDFPTVNPVQAVLGGASDVFVAKLNAAGDAFVYSTYLGGEHFDEGRGIAVDSVGNAYVTGFAGDDFPTAQALQRLHGGSGDAFVTKLDAAGKLVYSTYLGGSYEDKGFGIAVDAAGNAYVTGTTHSSDFPNKNPFQRSLGGSQDAFVTKLNAVGNALVYSTYLGGSGEGRSDIDEGNSIAVDASGNACVTGFTASDNFPTVNSLQAAKGSGAFVTKLNPAGNALVYSTYLGGYNGSGLAVDASGNAYVTGWTSSTNFSTLNPVQATFGGQIDAFVAKISQTEP